MSTEKPCHFAHLLQVSKKISLKSDFIHNFSCFLYIYIASGQGQTIPWGQAFNVNRKPSSLCPFVARLKKKSDFIHILNFCTYIYSPRSRADNPLGTNF